MLVLGSDRFGTGGVQAYARDVVAAFDGTGTVRSVFVTEVPGRGSRKPRFIARALRIGLSQQADIIFCTHIAGLPPAAVLSRVLRSARVYCALHGSEVFSGQVGTLPSWITGRVTTWLPVSEFTAGRFEALLPGARTVVLPNAISQDLLTSAQRSVRQPRSDPRILCVTRLEYSDRYKNVDGLLRAMPLVREVIPRVMLMVVGGGDDAPRLRLLAAQLGVTDVVTFIGKVPPRDLSSWYESATLFALPNRQLPSSGEGFGRVFLEAAAFGVPAVAGRWGGSAEAVLDGQTGLLVDGEEPAEIARAIVRVLTDDELRNRLSEGALRHAAGFRFEIFARRLEELTRSGGSR